MKYQVYPDGTIGIIKTDKKEETKNKDIVQLDKEMLERMSTYDTHKLFK